MAIDGHSEKRKVKTLANQLISNLLSRTSLFQYLFVKVLPYLNVCTFCRLTDFDLSQNKNPFVHGKLTKRLPRTFIFNFMKETLASTKIKNKSNDFLQLFFEISPLPKKR